MNRTASSGEPLGTGIGRIIARSSFVRIFMLYTTNCRFSFELRTKMFVLDTCSTLREKQHIGFSLKNGDDTRPGAIGEGPALDAVETTQIVRWFLAIHNVEPLNCQ